MGKQGKERKRRRLMAGIDIPSSSLPSPPRTSPVSNKRPRTEDNEPAMEDMGGLGEGQNLVPLQDLAATMRTLTALERHPEILKTKQFKGLRAALYRLHAGTTQGNSLVARVSEALADGRWTDSLIALAEMRYKGQVPKLGTLQRWVRDCDAARGPDGGGPETDQILRVLDSILRTADPSMVPKRDEDDVGPVKKHEPWAGCPRSASGPVIETGTDTVETYKSQFRVVFNEKGPDRRPINKYDATLYMSSPNTIDMSPSSSTSVSRIDVPNIPGCFFLKDVLTPSECNQILTAAESMGFTPDEPVSGAAASQVSILAHNFFWLADSSLLDTIYSRVQPHLPPELGGGAVAGLNARWRVYRYVPGAIYRPHIDGAWPCSGIDPVSGQYVYDMRGDRRSRLTFLVYLNDDFDGGGTTFFLPSATDGVLDGRVVSPRAGCVLCFPHGDAAGSLLHEGSAVTEGRKYIIRADVLYMLPPGAK
ncbi:hypothetical protein HK104_009475 [Borealophlyctis nickersoniae]|nr:hypothetical protein HK104_009475 [Borealophlyctis nickersoniae]